MKKSTLHINMYKDLIDDIRDFAENNGVSVSDILSQLVLNLTRDTNNKSIKIEESYEQSKKQALEILNKGFHMGVKIACLREEL